MKKKSLSSGQDLKVYVDSPIKSYALDRVRKALMDYAPGNVSFCNAEEADLGIFNVIGRRDAVSKQIFSFSKPYVIIQYSVRRTKTPSTEDWLELWYDSILTWSYYDLYQLCNEDGTFTSFPFYHSPLGVLEDFKQLDLEKKFIIATSGQSFLAESVRENIYAAKQLGLGVFHLGPEMGHDNTVCLNNIDDNHLIRLYNQCKYVSGLRRTEGFELPAAEGLLCGATPILFDKPHYRQWYDGFGIFIEENDRDGVISQLVNIFQKSYDPVSESKIQDARKLFDWETIIEGFWERCL